MGRPFNNATYGFSDKDANKIKDFLKASHNGEFNEVVRRAVPMYIDNYLDENQGVKRDYEKAKAEREKMGRS